MVPTNALIRGDGAALPSYREAGAWPPGGWTVYAADTGYEQPGR
jgi:hypothetical protein